VAPPPITDNAPPSESQVGKDIRGGTPAAPDQALYDPNGFMVGESGTAPIPAMPARTAPDATVVQPPPEDTSKWVTPGKRMAQAVDDPRALPAALAGTIVTPLTALGSIMAATSPTPVEGAEQTAQAMWGGDGKYLTEQEKDVGKIFEKWNSDVFKTFALKNPDYAPAVKEIQTLGPQLENDRNTIKQLLAKQAEAQKLFKATGNPTLLNSINTQINTLMPDMMDRSLRYSANASQLPNMEQYLGQDQAQRLIQTAFKPVEMAQEGWGMIADILKTDDPLIKIKGLDPGILRPILETGGGAAAIFGLFSLQGKISKAIKATDWYRTVSSRAGMILSL